MQLRRGGRGTPVLDPGAAAEEHEGRALFEMTFVVRMRSDDHIRVSVTVHVARACDAAEERLLLIGLYDRRVRTVAGNAIRTAVEHERGALVHLALS